MINVKRGDIVAIAIGGDYGKPRPALVIQSDKFDAIPSVTVLRMTSEVHEEEYLLRITVQPSVKNGLRLISQICIDKAVTIPRNKIGKTIGTLETSILKKVDHSLAIFLECGDTT